MTYTREGIMAQIWIAFGQGSGAIRISHDAALELHRWYHDALTPEIIYERWKTDAVQVLDRMRAIGRLAALRAASRGSTVITPQDVYESASAVQIQSATPLCPPEPPPLDEGRWPSVEAVASGAALAAAGGDQARLGAGRLRGDVREIRGS